MTATDTTNLSCADTAKLLRTALRETFPGVRFRVRSHTYSMGASINVTWADGPFEADVRRTCDLYRGSTFDSSQDLLTHHDSLLAQPDGSVRAVHFGADFIHTTRQLSPAYNERLRELASQQLGHQITGDGSQYLPTHDCYDNQYIRQLSQEIPA